MPTPIPDNPLNTGTTVNQAGTQNSVTGSTTPAPATPQIPINQAANTPAYQMPQQPVANTTFPPQPPAYPQSIPDDSRSSNTKNYLVVAIVGLIFLTIAFLAYRYFMKNDNLADEISENLENKISPESSQSSENADKAELEKVVNELKDKYENDSTADDSSSVEDESESIPSVDPVNTTPPGMNIFIPDNTTGEISGIPADDSSESDGNESSAPGNSGKIPR